MEQNYDVLLVDEQVGEALQLRQAWKGHGIRVIQCEGLAELEIFLAGGQPAKWPEPPYDFRVAVVDLDLGLRSEGPVGGLLVINRLADWVKERALDLPIVLRTGDIDDDRSLAAVLAAELLDDALPWWGKTTDQAMQLLEFVEMVAIGRLARPADYGAALIHPVDIAVLETPPRPLGAFLYGGPRPAVWRQVLRTDLQTAAAWSGSARHTKFWDDLSPVFEAVNHTREHGQPLHLLGGKVLRISDIELAIAEKEARDLDEAVAAIHEGQIRTSARNKNKLAQALSERRDRFIEWIEDKGKRPHRKNQAEQGEFLASYDRVLGHHQVIDLFEHKYDKRRA